MDAPNVKRREFFASFARVCLLGGLGATGALLAWRRWNAGACAAVRTCRACPLHAACPGGQRRAEGKP